MFWLPAPSELKIHSVKDFLFFLPNFSGVEMPTTMKPTIAVTTLSTTESGFCWILLPPSFGWVNIKLEPFARSSWMVGWVQLRRLNPTTTRSHVCHFLAVPVHHFCWTCRKWKETVRLSMKERFFWISTDFYCCLLLDAWIYFGDFRKVKERNGAGSGKTTQAEFEPGSPWVALQHSRWGLLAFGATATLSWVLLWVWSYWDYSCQSCSFIIFISNGGAPLLNVPCIWKETLDYEK